MASRYIDVTLDGRTWRMPASLAVYRQVAREVGDPLQAAVIASKGSLPWGGEELIAVVYIGVSAAGCSLSREQVGELMYEQGLGKFVGIVGEYIRSLVQGGPEKPLRSTEQARKKA